MVSRTLPSIFFLYKLSSLCKWSRRFAGVLQYLTMLLHHCMHLYRSTFSIPDTFLALQILTILAIPSQIRCLLSFLLTSRMTPRPAVHGMAETGCHLRRRPGSHQHDSRTSHPAINMQIRGATPTSGAPGGLAVSGRVKESAGVWWDETATSNSKWVLRGRVGAVRLEAGSEAYREYLELFFRVAVIISQNLCV